MIQPGTIIDNRYVIQDILGAGGFSTVYACTHAVLERKLALKILDASSISEEEVRARFLQEARILARLEHPNLVPVYDSGVYEGRPYLVMRRLQGKSSQANGQGMPVERVARLLIGVLEGLAVGHRRGIVHKDIKPENLILIPATREDPERLILTDFGVARDTDSSNPMTDARTVTGTPQYLAPEYILEQIVTPALDVYQMGLVFIEMVTGRAMVEGPTPYAVMMRHVSGPLSLPPELAHHPVAPILEQAIAFDHKVRFPNAGTFAAALERFLLGLAPTSPNPAPHVEPDDVFRRASSTSRIAQPSIELSELRGLIEGQRRVLVVDDDPDMRDLIHTVLEEVGIDVVEAENGTIGELLAFSEQPDLVICDQNMPRTTGLELISKLRQHSTTQHIPIIMLTAQQSIDVRVAGLRTGADDFITKPFAIEDLIARVGAVLRRARSDRTVDPLTKLPSNLAVSTELAHRIRRPDEPFVFCVSVLRDFEPYVSQYAFEATCSVVRRTSQLFLDSVLELGLPTDFIGVLASNRFALVLSPNRAMDVVSRVHREFKEQAPRFYNREDRQQGFFRVKSGLLSKRIPLISLWTALIESSPENSRSEATFARHIQSCLRDMLEKPTTGENQIVRFSAS